MNPIRLCVLATAIALGFAMPSEGAIRRDSVYECQDETCSYPYYCDRDTNQCVHL
ncbi:hypothetical protein BOTBODRAFT_51306 [Botryobasidium botryosum FD-172 SS1]|uniref:Uncharacterized protein n=1 Tax=Botryobasidium botryosum (strain FD-172 SS1) TaxID=930990 RepID=A0A067MZ15_BOTB1|nr:hypothetical protein BOTBODRAFT_51306 [Botryobasidium botryosum FD-172 SS1]